MTLRSLRLRLLAGAALAVFFSLAAAWVAMTLLFQQHIERRIEAELKADALQIVAALRLDPAGVPSLARRPTDARFDRAASGLYWQLSGGGMVLRSRSLWDQELPPAAATADWRGRVVPGPFGKALYVIERRLLVGSSRHLVVLQLAHDEEGLLSARNEFARELAFFLLVLWAVLSAAAWVQVHLGLRPLARLSAELLALRRNPALRLEDAYPDEVKPLTAAINELADAREADLTRARQRAADLAHALKTPLAALNAQSRRIRDGVPGAATEGLDRAIAAAAAAVENELARARAAAARQSGQAAEASPLAVAERLVGVLERTEKGMRLDYDLDVPGEMRLGLAEADLGEILGTLLENAVKFARRRVRLAAPSATSLTVEDDGPGIAAAQVAEAMARGRRLDESSGGHGLGLAIARQLIEATGGTMVLGTSDLGGLSVELVWPAAP